MLLPLPSAQVVSGDKGGTIVLWNLTDGRRAGGFSLHAAPASAAGTRSAGGGAASPSAAGGQYSGSSSGERLTAMAFDAAQRRLLTATDAGGLRAYNFNSGRAQSVGLQHRPMLLLLLPPLRLPADPPSLQPCRAVLREFQDGSRRRGSRQHEGGREVTAVAFVAAAASRAATQQAPDEAGEACEVQPAGEEPASRQQESSGPQPLEVGAAGSSEGYSELSEHALLSMQPQRASQAHGPPVEGCPSGCTGSDSSNSSDAPNLVLATGWCRALCVWEEGEERVCDSSRRLPGHAADVLSLAPLGPHVAATGERGGGKCLGRW